MKATEAKYGRVFVITLDTDDHIPDCIEAFSKENNIRNALVTFVGGLYNGNIITGPQKTKEMPPVPVRQDVVDAYDSLAVGILAINENGNPILHIHGSLGRKENILTGCLRGGINIWTVGEVILQEIITDSPIRIYDPETKFSILRLQ